jgi:hypothetical protein
VIRKGKCRRSAPGLPGGLKIESFVETTNSTCVVSASEQALHVVEISNRSLIPFKMNIEARSESELLSFPPEEQSWAEPKVEISDRPKGGGQFIRKVEKKLACDDTSTDQGIIVFVKYEAIGPRCSGSAEIMLLVDTRA